jgi:Plasmid pRiA4b ORF-3-like protein
MAHKKQGPIDPRFQVGPPKDVGGVSGSAEFLEAIADTDHDDHLDIKEWIGGKFGPETLSVNKVNRELKQQY